MGEYEFMAKPAQNLALLVMALAVATVWLSVPMVGTIPEHGMYWRIGMARLGGGILGWRSDRYFGLFCRLFRSDALPDATGKVMLM